VKTYTALLTLAIALAACTAPTTPKSQTNAPAGQASSAAHAPDENAALETLGKITEAQSTYFKKNRRYALGYDELVEAHLLTGEPSAAQTGYEFKLRPAADAQTYSVSVVPVDSSATSARRFFADQTGVVRSESGKDATADSLAVK
jgi:hypothetical protein